MEKTMRVDVRRDANPLPFMGSMAWIAVASFVAGFAGFLLFGTLTG